MTPPLVTGPQPYENDPPIQPQNYQPSQFVISSVTLGQTTTITTNTDLNYVVGQLVRLLIPYGYGCTQLNEKTGYVLSIPSSNQVVISIDSSRNVDAFKTSTNRQYPQILAIGDINSGIQSSTGVNIPTTNIPGAFIDIS